MGPRVVAAHVVVVGHAIELDASDRSVVENHVVGDIDGQRNVVSRVVHHAVVVRVVIEDDIPGRRVALHHVAATRHDDGVAGGGGGYD